MQLRYKIFSALISIVSVFFFAQYLCIQSQLFTSINSSFFCFQNNIIWKKNKSLMLYHVNVHSSEQHFCHFYFQILPWLAFVCSMITWMWSNDDGKIQVVTLYSSHTNMLSKGFAVPESIITALQFHICWRVTKRDLLKNRKRN